MLAIEHVRSTGLHPDLARAVGQLCDAAYQEDTAPYFAALGPGDHLLGLLEGQLVSHLMWVTRWLQPGNQPLLRTAYVEMVATAPAWQRRGYATALLERVPGLVQEFDLAALSPATDGIYLRLGWRYWEGPLSARRDGTLLPTPEERVMILRLPKTPVIDPRAPLSVEWRPGEIW